MPGQGLAKPKFNAKAQSQQYDSLLQQYQQGLTTYGPGMAAGNLRSLDAILNGQGGQPGASALYQNAIRTADPENSRLLDMLTERATSEFALDNQLDPNQNRLIEQAGRAGAAARGMCYGPADLMQEQFAKLGYGEQLRDKRRGNALTIQQLRQALAQKPVDWATQTSLSQNPEQGMWGALLSSYSENQQNARKKSDLETKIGMDQADKWNGWFKMAAGGLACWAAREVFGATDIRWLQFRQWMLFDAPEKFRAWYLANGERWAARLAENPAAKAVVKRWMERRLRHAK